MIIIIHLALLEDDRIHCPFCDKTIKENEIVEEKCENQTVNFIDSSFACINCGLVHSYDLKYCKFIDFNNNMNKFRKKSVYIRKYHIEKVIYEINDQYGIQISRNDINKIIKVFDLIEKIEPQINSGRKRLISMRFIIGKLIHMMNLSSNEIKASKSKETIKHCNKYWSEIKNLIGDEIDSILNQQI